MLLEQSGLSFCLPRQPSLSALRTRIKVIAILSAILGFSGILGGVVVAALVSHRVGQNSPFLYVALCCSVLGIAIMFVPVMSERRVVRRNLSPAAGNLTSGSAQEGFHVAIENASTVGKPKILAEDVGLMYIYPDATYVKINGLSYDYVIQSKDVAELSLHSGKTVLLSYRVGHEQLKIAIIPRSIRAELKRQTMGSSQTLLQLIQGTLHPNR
ncbi:MAG TPA: hypothetical protein VMD30_08610 [Tepidisphaeraceae bacterium]|nr:hypothetical protein [Tepidisphaeraceae bacterium]